ncbi:hypothetical protein LI82_11840 [Methanococcoides methylutens]|uniref:Sialyltransferase n=1 Tax=Methanococcoides methylutens TaxID=2226 RepID=A0A099T0A9_METMT|nr:hypothetical protein [Methanococcoides methylutens]KGK98389.1 hypothetical protein LI82_11840 [Methanococcoides methylutens]
MSVKTICEKIWELEDKYGLLHKDIQGVKVWQISRFLIYSEIAQKTGVFTKPHTTKDSLKDNIKAFPSYFYNAIIKNPLSGNYEKDVLVFDHPRKILVDGEYIDIYTKYLLDDLEASQYEVIESPYLSKHFSKNEMHRKYLDRMLLLSYLYTKISNIKFTTKELNWIDSLEYEINSHFNIDLNFKNFFSEWIIQFKCYYKFYEKLLQKRNPSTIFVVVSYGTYNIPLISAAKDNDIQVIEIQHGTISPYHLGYNFPNCNQELAYFPDIFYSFGTYWNDIVNFPICKKNIICYGFPYMRTRKEKYNKAMKKKKQILFLSQGAIGKELAKFVYEAAQVLDEYNIVYKLHPGEYDRWEKEYNELVLANHLKNVEVISDNKKELYHYFAESEYQIGVFSTAIYEGLAFKCKTLLVDLPGIEYMSSLIEKEIVTKVTNVEDLKCQIEFFEPKYYDEDYFFSEKKNHLAKIKN